MKAWSKRRAQRILSAAARGIAAGARVDNDRSMMRVATVADASGADDEDAFRGRLMLANWRASDIALAVQEVKYTRTGATMLRFVDRRPQETVIAAGALASIAFILLPYPLDDVLIVACVAMAVVALVGLVNRS